MKSIGSNPGKCPECGNELTNKNWRSHLKNRHMYSYNSYMYAHTQINSTADIAMKAAQTAATVTPPIVTGKQIGRAHV